MRHEKKIINQCEAEIFPSFSVASIHKPIDFTNIDDKVKIMRIYLKKQLKDKDKLKDKNLRLPLKRETSKIDVQLDNINQMTKSNTNSRGRGRGRGILSGTNEVKFKANESPSTEQPVQIESEEPKSEIKNTEYTEHLQNTEQTENVQKLQTEIGSSVIQSFTTEQSQKALEFLQKTVLTTPLEKFSDEQINELKTIIYSNEDSVKKSDEEKPEQKEPNSVTIKEFVPKTKVNQLLNKFKESNKNMEVSCSSPNAHPSAWRWDTQYRAQNQSMNNQIMNYNNFQPYYNHANQSVYTNGYKNFGYQNMEYSMFPLMTQNSVYTQNFQGMTDNSFYRTMESVQIQQYPNAFSPKWTTH